MKTLFTMLVISSCAFASPVIRCGKDAPGSTFFELSADSDYFTYEYRETIPEDATQSVVFGLNSMKARSGHRFQVTFKFPLKTYVGSPTNVCQMSLTNSSLFGCTGSFADSRLVVRNLTQADEFEVPLYSFRIYNDLQTQARVIDWGQSETQTISQINTDFYASTGSVRRSMPVSECKSVSPSN